jgi:catalase
MAVKNPHGRVNYEPNSWNLGPRETPRGFTSYAAQEDGTHQRVRSEKFADHYSQARQFYISQTPVEQQHIADALVFELSKVETPEIRARMVSHLVNIDGDLAKSVATGLGLKKIPPAAKAAKAPIADLEPSPSLSILKNGPDRFSGRCLGILIGDGANADEVNAVISAATNEGATYKVISAHIEGVRLSDGSMLKVEEKIDGGPSVLFDAIAILASEKSAPVLAKAPAARDFVNDALSNHKFVAVNSAAATLLPYSVEETKGQVFEVRDKKSAASFITACGQLRFWEVVPSLAREGK